MKLATAQNNVVFLYCIVTVLSVLIKKIHFLVVNLHVRPRQSVGLKMKHNTRAQNASILDLVEYII